jgi:glutamate racemase
MKQPVRIGMIDSGKGGLTVANAIAHNPGFEIYYYADTKNLPYGPKTPEQLLVIFNDAVSNVMKYNVDYIILPCHTLSTLIYKKQIDLPVPIISMLQTVIPQAVRASQTKSIGILATQASINTHAHKHALLQINSSLNVVEQACPELASAIEIYSPDDKKITDLLIGYLQSMQNQSIDTIILGCTHYAYVHDQIKQIVAHPVQLVSSEMNIIDVMHAMKLISHCTQPSTIIQI